MPETEKKLTPIEIAKVFAKAAYTALEGYEEDAKLDMSEVMELVQNTIKDVLVEAND